MRIFTVREGWLYTILYGIVSPYVSILVFTYIANQSILNIAKKLC